MNSQVLNVTFIMFNSNSIYVDRNVSRALFLYPKHQFRQRKIVDVPLSTMFLKEFQFPLVCAFLLALVFSMNYVSLWLGFRISHLRKKTVKVPPTIPYFIPFLGSTYNFGFNGLKFVDSST